MLRSYLATAQRALLSGAWYTSINVVGLAVGMGVCVLIGLYVAYESSYDDVHPDAERVYRLASDLTTPEQTVNIARSAPAMGPVLVRERPEVATAARLSPVDAGMVLTRGEDAALQSDVYYADPSAFDVFDFGVTAGAKQSFAAPGRVVLSRALASRYFPNGDAVGQTLEADEATTLEVVGVMDGPDGPTHLPVGALVSFATLEAQRPQSSNWLQSSTLTYLKLAPGASRADVEAALPDFVARHVGDRLASIGADLTLVLQPLTDIYLHSDRLYEAGPTGSITTLYAASAIALFVLLIACFNFTNLTTARSATRAREVAVRKSLGAHPSALMSQFLGESIALSSVALVLGLGLCRVVLFVVDDAIGVPLTMDPLYAPLPLLTLAALVGLVGVVAGGYPALHLARREPATVLRATRGSLTPSGGSLRKGLVVFQFAVSIALFVGTAVVFKQLWYVQTTDVGFDETDLAVVTVHDDSDAQDAMAPLLQEWARLPGVASVTASSSVPGEPVAINTYTTVDLPGGGTYEAALNTFAVDFDFAATYALRLVAGRTLDPDYARDSTRAVVVNEAMVEQLGLPDADDAVGLTVDQERTPATIVGVVEDFHYASLRKDVAPVVMRYDPSRARRVSVKFDTADPAATLASMKSTWDAFVPQHPFEHAFLSDRLDAQYASERRFATLFSLFAGLAIFIACLGLLGLAAHTAEQRIKEVGIRKAVGASASNIVVLLSWDFVKLVLVAFVVASPIAYVGMQQWLRDFAARTDLGPALFLAAGMLAAVLALATVGYQALATARTNPADVLRAE